MLALYHYFFHTQRIFIDLIYSHVHIFLHRHLFYLYRCVHTQDQKNTTEGEEAITPDLLLLLAHSHYGLRSSSPLDNCFTSQTLPSHARALPRINFLLANFLLQSRYYSQVCECRCHTTSALNKRTFRLHDAPVAADPRLQQSSPNQISASDWHPGTGPKLGVPFLPRFPDAN